MSLLIALFLSCPAQEKYPAADHAWLCFKTGTSITNRIAVESGGNNFETLQKMTLKEKNGDDYVIEETGTANGQELPARLNKTGTGTVTGQENITVDGKEYSCQVSLAKGQRVDGETETRYWMPQGNKYPLKVRFKQTTMTGEVTAVALDEKVKVGDTEYLCAKLQGKVKLQDSEGTMTVWVSQMIPGAQAGMELVVNAPKGEVKIKVTPTEIHLEK
ncbi:MAG TPA: hypothetical protein VE981_19695 [Planctomycetota bacterium]|nr:hypothetical protein [Planctomycetota bacterium]